MAVNGEQVLPIDVHIFRIMKRLGIAGERDDYESLRAKLESEIPPKQRMKTHLILIEFGRQICRARNPKCEECPIKRYCEVGKKGFRRTEHTKFCEHPKTKNFFQGNLQQRIVTFTMLSEIDFQQFFFYQ